MEHDLSLVCGSGDESVINCKKLYATDPVYIKIVRPGHEFRSVQLSRDDALTLAKNILRILADD